MPPRSGVHAEREAEIQLPPTKQWRLGVGYLSRKLNRGLLARHGPRLAVATLPWPGTRYAFFFPNGNVSPDEAAMPPRSGVHVVRCPEISLLRIKPIFSKQTWRMTVSQTQPWLTDAAWAPARGRYAPLAGGTEC